MARQTRGAATDMAEVTAACPESGGTTVEGVTFIKTCQTSHVFLQYLWTISEKILISAVYIITHASALNV